MTTTMAFGRLEIQRGIAATLSLVLISVLFLTTSLAGVSKASYSSSISDRVVKSSIAQKSSKIEVARRIQNTLGWSYERAKAWAYWAVFSIAAGAAIGGIVAKNPWALGVLAGIGFVISWYGKETAINW